MIEKFTKEELEIIKKELAELPKSKNKRELCKQSFERLRESYKNSELSGAPHPYYLEDAILMLCDCFIGNFEKAYKVANRKYKGDYNRYGYVRDNISGEYAFMVSEIVDVLEKHAHMYTEE